MSSSWSFLSDLSYHFSLDGFLFVWLFFTPFCLNSKRDQRNASKNKSSNQLWQQQPSPSQSQWSPILMFDLNMDVKFLPCSCMLLFFALLLYDWLWLHNCMLEQVFRCSYSSIQWAYQSPNHSCTKVPQFLDSFLLLLTPDVYLCVRAFSTFQRCHVISVRKGLDNSAHAELNGVLVKLTLSFNIVKICSNMITVIIAELLCHSIISRHVTALLHSEMWEVDESETKRNAERWEEKPWIFDLVKQRQKSNRDWFGVRQLLELRMLLFEFVITDWL